MSEGEGRLVDEVRRTSTSISPSSSDGGGCSDGSSEAHGVSVRGAQRGLHSLTTASGQPLSAVNQHSVGVGCATSAPRMRKALRQGGPILCSILTPKARTSARRSAPIASARAWQKLGEKRDEPTCMSECWWKCGIAPVDLPALMAGPCVTISSWCKWARSDQRTSEE